MNAIRTSTNSIQKLEKLTAEESENIQGGFWGPYFVGYVLLEAALNPQAHVDAFVKGFKEGYDAYVANR